MTFPVTVSLRANQDTRLTNTQADNNFSNLAAAVNDLSGAVVSDATAGRSVATADAWKWTRLTAAGAVSMAIPLGLSLGTYGKACFFSVGAGGVTFVPADGVTVNAVSLSLAQFRAATLIQVGTNVFDLIGGLE